MRPRPVVTAFRGLDERADARQAREVPAAGHRGGFCAVRSWNPAAPCGWTTSRSLDDMFDPGMLAIPDLAASVPRCSMVIEDLASLSDDDLQARSLAAFQKLALWLLRDARAPRRLL